nr:sodium-independent sulfate anion transporter [Helicoverpa armigera]
MRIFHPKKCFSNMLKVPNPKKLIRRVFPILQWSRTYDARAGVGDLIAGITIALTLVPQSIAYASLAGFEPQYGLYSSFMGPFVYAIMGTSPQVNLGPSALISLLTFTYTNGTNPDFAILLCLMAGIVQLVAGVAQLGFLVEFISLPVVSGFTSAAAITIASSQVKGLLGLRYNADTFVTTWANFFKHVHETRLTDSMLSLGCCLVLIGMRALKDIKIKDKAADEKGSRKAKILKRFLWFTGVARNAVVVCLASVTAFILHEDKYDPFLLSGTITAGLPAVRPPAFETTVGNTTYTGGDMLSHLGSGLAVVPIVAILSNVAIAKAFAKGKTVDATQEIVALGVCNIVSAFFQSMPVNGSFSRSAVSDASGVKTPGSGIYTGIIVILTLVLLTPYFYFIPRAALASVIVCAVLQMVDYNIIKKMWKTSRLDIIPLLGTFLCCLFLGIEIGLVCGVGIDALLLLYYHSRPPLDVQYVDDGILPPHYAIRPVGGLHFAGAERVRHKLFTLQKSKPFPPVTTIHTINNISENETRRSLQWSVPHNGAAMSVQSRRNDVEALGVRPAHLLVIYCDALYRLDYTFLQSMKMLVMDWSRTGRVIWCDARQSVRDQLSSVLTDPIFCDSVQLKSLLSGPSEEMQTTNNDTAF